MISVVVISAGARKDLRKCPSQIVQKLMIWIGSVQAVGLEETRKCKGFHDESLRGDWKGSHSIRLNRAYRAIYTVKEDATVEFALVENVTKHKY